MLAPCRFKGQLQSSKPKYLDDVYKTGHLQGNCIAPHRLILVNRRLDIFEAFQTIQINPLSICIAASVQPGPKRASGNLQFFAPRAHTVL